jgi:hypothetical protein
MRRKVEMYESQATGLYVTRGVLFPFPSKVSVGAHNINNTNAFSKVLSCLKL